MGHRVTKGHHRMVCAQGERNMNPPPPPPLCSSGLYFRDAIPLLFSHEGRPNVNGIGMRLLTVVDTSPPAVGAYVTAVDGPPTAAARRPGIEPHPLHNDAPCAATARPPGSTGATPLTPAFLPRPLLCGCAAAVTRQTLAFDSAVLTSVLIIACGSSAGLLPETRLRKAALKNVRTVHCTSLGAILTLTHTHLHCPPPPLHHKRQEGLGRASNPLFCCTPTRASTAPAAVVAARPQLPPPLPQDVSSERCVQQTLADVLFGFLIN